MRVRVLAATAAALALTPAAATAAPAPWSPSGPTPGGQVDRLVVDPANPARAVAIVTTVDVDDPSSQLFETLDAGRTWTAGATALPNMRRVSATTPLAIANGAVWTADGSGVCQAATAAGPFACSDHGAGLHLADGRHRPAGRARAGDVPRRAPVGRRRRDLVAAARASCRAR